MQTRSLQTLVRIHQVQSFTRAARLQNMTLSALSMQMRALEDELGKALFDRNFRPPKLTPLGRQVARQAANVLEQQSRLEALCGATGELIGQYRFGFIQSASVRILPGFMRHMRRIAPKAQIDLATGLSETLSAQVASGQLDGAVVTRTPDLSPELVLDTIATEPMAAGIPKKFADARFEDITNKLPLIHFRPSTGIGKLIAAALGDMRVTSGNVMVLDGIEACVECVKSGLGFTVLPLPDLQRYADDRIVLKTDLTPPLARDLALVTRDDPVTQTWRAQIRDSLCDVAGKAAG